MLFFLYAITFFLFVDVFFGLSALMKSRDQKFFSAFAFYVIYEFVLFLWALTLLQRA